MKHFHTDVFQKKEFSPEMRLYDDDGLRLYITADERARFLESAREEAREHLVYCHLLHYTGCRPAEALEVSTARIDTTQNTIVFRTLKKRKHDNKGRVKKPHFRPVPVPAHLIEKIDLVFDLRERMLKRRTAEQPLWSMPKPTAWCMVTRVMDRANIHGPQATGKGLRHGFGIACVLKNRPLHKIRDWWGILIPRPRRFTRRWWGPRIVSCLWVFGTIDTLLQALTHMR